MLIRHFRYLRIYDLIFLLQLIYLLQKPLWFLPASLNLYLWTYTFSTKMDTYFSWSLQRSLKALELIFDMTFWSVVYFFYGMQ